jgi:hydrogenase expression/formation protein HypC
MCLAIPGQVVSVDSNQADVDFGGVVKKVNVSLVDARVGEWVVVHAGFAIEKMDEEEARETLQLWSEMLDQEEEEASQ